MIATVLAIVIVLGEWTGMARALVGKPLYAASLDVVLVGLVAVSVLRVARSGTWPRPHALDGLVALYFLLALVQIANPNVPSATVGLEGFRKTAFTMLGYSVIRLQPPPRPLRWHAIFVVGSMPAFILAVAVFASPTAISDAIVASSGASAISFHSGPVLRAFVPTAGPFHLGLLAGIALVGALALFGWGPPRWRLVMAACVSVSAITLATTLTRANIIAAVVAVGISAVGLAVSTPRAAAALGVVGRAALAALLVIVVAFGVSKVYVPPTVVMPNAQGSPSTSSGPTTSAGNGGTSGAAPVEAPDLNPLEDRSMQFRLQYWTDQLAAVAERPLVGWGTGSAADGFDHFYDGTGKRNFESHSLYFKSALELGGIGLALMLAILATIALQAVRLQKRHPRLAAITLGTLTMLAVSGMSGPMLDAYPANLFFWSMAALALAAGSGATEPIASTPGASASDDP